MALPKRRNSRTRGRKRRTHYTLSRPSVQKCPNCGEIKRPHRVCGSCGWYSDRVIPGIVAESAEDSKK